MNEADCFFIDSGSENTYVLKGAHWPGASFVYLLYYLCEDPGIFVTGMHAQLTKTVLRVVFCILFFPQEDILWRIL